MANTFINRLITKIEFQGAGQISNLLFGVGRGFDALQKRAASAAAGVAAATRQLEQAQGKQSIFGKTRAERAMDNRSLAYKRWFAGERQRIQQEKVVQNLRQRVSSGLAFPGSAALPGQLAQAEARLAQLQAASARAKENLSSKSRALASALQNEARAQKALTAAMEREAAARAALAESRRQFVKGLVIAGVIAAATTLFAFGKAAADTAIEFETMRTQLGFLYRDAAKGDMAFKWMQQFAAKSPFRLEGVMEGFRDLLTLGIQPTEKRLRSLGGMADLFNRSFSDAAKAVGFGIQGNFARLRRGFAITQEEVKAFAARTGRANPFGANNKVKDKKGLLALLLGDDQQNGIIQAKYGEYMKRLEGTTRISLQNVEDSWKNFLGRVGASTTGPLKGLFDRAAKFLNSINEEKVTRFMQGVRKTALALLTILQMIVQVLEQVTKLSGGKSGSARSENLKKFMDPSYKMKTLAERQQSNPFTDIRKGINDAIKSLSGNDDVQELRRSRINDMKARGMTDKQINAALKFQEGMQGLRTVAGASSPNNLTFIPKAPGTDQFPGGEGGGGVDKLVRQVLGGLGDAAKFEIKASELPGRNETGIKKTTFNLRLLGEHGKVEDGILELFERWLGQLESHGAVTIHAGAS